MQFLIFTALLTAVLSPLKLPLIEVIATVLLLAPVFFVGTAAALAVDPASYTFLYLAIFAVLCGTVWVLGWGQRNSTVAHRPGELWYAAIFAVAFLLFYVLARVWPDFFPLGERLRDYALLAAVIDSPISVREPWLPGAELNYYAYWYRFGHMLHALLGLSTWEIYHQLQAITCALYLTLSIRLFRTYLNFDRWAAAFGGIFIVLGSNLAGVYYLFEKNVSWWGPSRVILGAINEFPAWSFLLGDVHPHFLNLPMLLFFVVSFLAFVRYAKDLADVFLLFIFYLVAAPLLVYNSNAWDLPVWLGFAAVFMLLALAGKNIRLLRAPSGPYLARGLILLLGLVLAASALYSCQNISPTGYEVRFVFAPVKRSMLAELARHWGFPLFLVSVGVIALLREGSRIIATAILLFSVLIFSEALPLLIALAVLNSWRLILRLIDLRRAGQVITWPELMIEMIGVSALGLIIVPELMFLDDPYGGDNERMNTIFKLYSVSWGFMHAFAFYLIRSAWLSGQILRPRRWVALVSQAVALLFFLAFFVRVVPQRASLSCTEKPCARGLSSVEREFPGAAQVIKRLSQEPRQVVLEAQGNPYSFTTHVASLSGHDAYLGWSNHVQLLTKKYDEVRRRTEETERLYRDKDCETKRLIAEREQISFIVLGPLETQAYPDASSEHFDCFNKLIKAQRYEVYSLHSSENS